MGSMDKIIEVPQSPEVAAFEKYGNLSANLYTGTPNISIPLYTFKGHEISLPVILTYDASGIKVEQIATNVGLGWNLNYGGVVSRQVNHLPDQISYGEDIPFPVFGNYMNIMRNYFYSQGATPSLLGYHQSGGMTHNLKQLYKRYTNGINIQQSVDTQADTFSFSVNGISGTIVIDYANIDPNTNEPRAYCIENPDIKVEVDANLGNTALSSELISWTIIDTNGTRYLFDEPETTWNEYSVDANEFTREYHSAWYLKKIISANGLDEFEFNYSNDNFWGDRVDRLEKQRVRTTAQPSVCTNGQEVSLSPTPQHNYYKIKQFHLGSISYNGTTVMTTSTDDRIDLPGLDRYEKLTFKNDMGQDVLYVDLNNEDYFRAGQSPSQDNSENTRLKLDGISIYRDINESPKEYSFEYFSQNSVPGRNCNAVDYWGYYNNGSCNGDLLAKPTDGSSTHGQYRTPDFNKTKIGTMEYMSYPTGGKTQFVYEKHSVLKGGQTVQIGGLRLKKTVDYEKDNTVSVTKHYYYNDLNQKILDGTFSASTITPTSFDPHYDSSGTQQQGVVFWENKTVRRVTFDNVCAVSTLFQYSHNLAQQVPHNVTYNSVSEVLFKEGDFKGVTVSHFYNTDYGSTFKPTAPYINREILNGDVEYVRVYRPSGSNLMLMQETQNILSNELINDPSLPEYQGIYLYERFEQEATGFKGCLDTGSVDPYGMNTIDFINQGPSGFPPNLVWNCWGGGTPYESYVKYDVNKYKISKRWKKLQMTISKTIEGAREIVDTTTYTYGPNHYMATNIKSNDSKGLEKEINVFYTPDVIGQGLYNATDENIFQTMADRNQISEMVMVEQFYDNTLMSTQKKFYADVATSPLYLDVFRPTSIEVSKGTNSLEERRIIHSYYANGNPTEISEPDGSKTFYVWGYNGKQLIAQVVNRKLGIPSSIVLDAINASNADANGTSEYNITQKLKAIRDYFFNSQVTTYTYDPGIGLTSMTDPRGLTIYYEYDHLNRLKRVKDSDNNILSENEYSYRINN